MPFLLPESTQRTMTMTAATARRRKRPKPPLLLLHHIVISSSFLPALPLTTGGGDMGIGGPLHSRRARNVMSAEVVMAEVEEEEEDLGGKDVASPPLLLPHKIPLLGWAEEEGDDGSADKEEEDGLLDGRSKQRREGAWGRE